MSLKKFFKFLVLTGVFVVPFTALIVVPGFFFPYITGKAFFFRAVVEIIFCAWLVLAFRDIEYRPKKSYILYAFAFFLVTLGISDALAINSSKAFWSNFERMEGFVTMVHLFLYFIVLSSVLKTTKLWDWFWRTSLISFSIVGMYAINQFLNTTNRLDSTLGNPAYLGIYSVFAFFLVLYLIHKDFHNKLLVSLYSVVGFVSLFTLYYSGTRGSILGLLGGLGICAILIALFEKKHKALRMTSIGILTTFLVLGSLFFALRDSNFVQSSPVLKRFADISITEQTTKSRLMIWNMAWQGVQEKPLFGWGQENFNYVFNKYYVPEMYDQEPWFDRTHNVILDWAIAGGIFGLLGYLALFITAIYELFRNTEHRIAFGERVILVGVLAGYFIHNLFVFDNLISYIFIFAILAFIHHLSAKPIRAIHQEDTIMAETDIWQVVVPTVFVLLLIAVYFVNIQPIQTSRNIIKGLFNIQVVASQNNPTNVRIVVDAFKKAGTYGFLGQSEMREQTLQAISVINSSSADIALKQEFFTFVESEMVEQLRETPKDARYQLFASNFYLSYGLYSQALIHAIRAQELSQKKQAMLFQIGYVHWAQKQYESALSYFKQAYELEPKFEQATKLYSAALIYAGKQKEADAVLLEAFKTTAIDDDIFVRLYMDLGKWDKVSEIWKKRAAQNPFNIQVRSQLIASYLKLNKSKQAIEELKQILTWAPQYKDQIAQYIKDIEAGKDITIGQ